MTTTPEDLARRYAAGFPDTRPWSADEITALITRPGGFAVTTPQAFAIGHVVLDEAEVITLATDPDARGQGHGRAIVVEFATRARALGATRAFLEVAEDNTPARALYAATGWQVTGQRPRYYPRPDGAVDAVLMALDLTICADMA